MSVMPTAFFLNTNGSQFPIPKTARWSGDSAFHLLTFAFFLKIHVSYRRRVPSMLRFRVRRRLVNRGGFFIPGLRSFLPYPGLPICSPYRAGYDSFLIFNQKLHSYFSKLQLFTFAFCLFSMFFSPKILISYRRRFLSILRFHLLHRLWNRAGHHQPGVKTPGYPVNYRCRLPKFFGTGSTELVTSKFQILLKKVPVKYSCFCNHDNPTTMTTPIQQLLTNHSPLLKNPSLQLTKLPLFTFAFFLSPSPSLHFQPIIIKTRNLSGPAEFFGPDFFHQLRTIFKVLFQRIHS